MTELSGRSPHENGRSDSTDHLGDTRAAGEILLGALAGSALLPFVQAITTKAGEDAYQLIRSVFTRWTRRRAARADLRRTGVVTLADPATRVALQLPRTITPTMAVQLDQVRLPEQRTAWILIRWDARRTRWLTEECDEPPHPAQDLE
ncbi:hypothetical protein [Nocardia sp. NPDC019395]|uniref:hypothetical protein n=1 Tax=Nocardia sp. NPDC019395 TaxID=3154686 RepID=UPI003401661B